MFMCGTLSVYASMQCICVDERDSSHDTLENLYDVIVYV